MKKVLFILHFPPPVHGAAMVGQYIRESKKINTDITWRYINLGTSRTIEEIGKSGLKKWWRFVTLLLKTGHQIVRFRPNLVYLTLTAKGGGFYKDAWVALLAKVLGAKMVYHFHNKGVSTRQDKWLDNLLYKIVFKNADVILLSENLYPDIQKYVPKNRVHICPNGIPDTVAGTTSKSQNKENRPVEILFLSNLIESKGVLVLLAACKIIKEHGIPFKCTYVGGEGDISPEQLQQNIDKLGLENEVRYVGKKYGAAKSEEFSKADIFVHPSLNDCFPLVLLEAMQNSLSIVSTYEGAIPEIIDEGVTGFVVSKQDEVALAAKLETLIKDKELRSQMGAAGRTKYESLYTLDAFEKRFTQTLQQLLG